MAVKVFNVGQVLAAADVNAWFIPTSIAVKPSDEGRTATAYSNDSNMLLAVSANASYMIEGALEFDATFGEDFKTKFTVPSAAAGLWNDEGNSSTPNAISWVTSTPGVGATPTLVTVTILGCFVTGANAGNLQLQWAKNAAGAGTTTTLKKNSYLMAWRIG